MRARFIARLAAPGAVLLVSAGLATAQQAHWTSIGPRGGEISQIVFDPADPTRVYATSARSGVFTSRNGGRLWQPTNAGLPVAARLVQAIAVAGSELLIGTGSDGAWRSVDAGAHWTPAGFAQLDVRAVGLDPGSSGLAFASIDFDPDHTGVWSSRDSGASWQRADGGIEGLVAGNFVVHPGTQSPAVVYAGFVGRNDQLAGRCEVKSVDDGVHWSVLGSGLPVPASPFDDQQCFIALDPAAPATLYLAMRIFAGAPEVLTTATFKSVDGGEHWQQMAGPGGFPIATGAGDSVWTPLGRSGDGGATWRTFPQPIPTVVPFDELVSPGGLAPIPGIADQALMSDLPAGVVRVVGGGDAVLLSNRGLIAVAGAELAVRATQPTSFLARTEFGLVQHSGPGTLWQTAGPPLGDNFAYLQPLVHPADPDLLYAQAFAASPDDGIVISNDGGEHWRTLRGPGSRILQLAPSPLSTRVLYAAVGGLKAGDCGLFVSKNLARHWGCLGLPAPMRGVVVDRKAESTLYGLPAPRPEVPGESERPLQKSVDAGQTWHASQVGAGGWPMALAIASSRSHRIYLATSAGMFRSDDDGARWQPAGNGLPPALFGVLEPVAVVVDPGRPEVAYVGVRSRACSERATAARTGRCSIPRYRRACSRRRSRSILPTRT